MDPLFYRQNYLVFDLYQTLLADWVHKYQHLVCLHLPLQLKGLMPKFAVAVDLPTPPFPEAIAMIFFTFGKVSTPVCTLCD